ncbi:Protein prenyltransferase alpha subunit repeat-containing protein 1-B (Fragment) [Linum grandiflorum]
MIQDAALPDLLNQFEQILDDDPLINEVGFIHPSQLAALEKRAESDSSQSQSSSLLDPGDDHFWIQNHKLGISSDILLQLYAAARKEFMNAVVEYKKLVDPSHPSAEALETAVMKHSKALLLLSPDFGTAWNSRKLIASKKQQASMFIDELRLSALVLSYSPKSEQAWCHRRWVVKNLAAKCSTLPEILEEESDLVEKIAEVLQQLKKSKGWAALNVADNSCFHYRMRLIIRILEDCCRKQEEGCCDSCVEVYWLWQEELEWNEELIKRYLGREQSPESRKFELRDKIDNEQLNTLLKLVSLRGPPFGAI